VGMPFPKHCKLLKMCSPSPTLVYYRAVFEAKEKFRLIWFWKPQPLAQHPDSPIDVPQRAVSFSQGLQVDAAAHDAGQRA
jgi:hypothetical protein